MYVTVKDFIREWQREAMLTQKVFRWFDRCFIKSKSLPGRKNFGKNRVAYHHKYSGLFNTIRD